MTQISLHILDLAQNCVSAGATLVQISVDMTDDIISFKIVDNGCGMSREMVEKVVDPFITTRTTRKVGLGISLTKAAAQDTGGSFNITSELGVGTTVQAVFMAKHIDCQPMGELHSTIASLISGNPDIDVIFTFKSTGEFCLDTREMRQILAGVPFDNNDVAAWLLQYIEDGIKSNGKCNI